MRVNYAVVGFIPADEGRTAKFYLADDGNAYPVSPIYENPWDYACDQSGDVAHLFQSKDLAVLASQAANNQEGPIEWHVRSVEY